ncbi:MAG: hypothetical protein ABEL04_07085 [Salinibacter sp.]|uniref:hypothetical protein n=1 Tax=Salinibacter sp. TaxID=2065818 RepID=UPI0035D51786
MLALYQDLLALRPKLGDAMRIDAPSDTTLRVERPPIHVAVTLEGAANLDLPPEAPCCCTPSRAATPRPHSRRP